MGTKRKFDFVLLIYAVFVSMLLISPAILAGNADECELVTRVFGLTGAEPAKLQVNGWVDVKTSDMDPESAAVYLANRLKSLARFGFTSAVTTADDGQGPILVAEGNVDSDVWIKVVLKNDVLRDEAGQKSAYLMAAVTTQNTSRTLKELNRYLLTIFPEEGLHRSVMLAGSLPGPISPSVVNEIVSRMVSSTGAQNVERLVIGHLVSITGYVPNVRTRLTLGEKSVNINIAVRYNSIENKTYLYAGSPIITNEY